MAKFNYREISRSMASSPSATKRVHTIVQRKFDTAKAEFLQEFDSHSVTQEIESKGELFGFIGFENGNNPIAPLKEILLQELLLTSSNRTGVQRGEAVQYKFSLRIPSESIRAATPMPWESGRSWVEALEAGTIGGFGRFMAGKFDNPPSRSEQGIQAKNIIRQDDYPKRKYLSELYRKLVQSTTEQ